MKDLRILAIRTEPPEMLFSYAHTIPAEQRDGLLLPQHTLSMDALVVDPKGRALEVTLRFCPDDSTDVGCPGYRLPLSTPPAQVQAMGSLVVPRSVRGGPMLLLGGELPMPRFPLTFSSSALDFMTPRSPLTVVNPELPTLVVRAATLGGQQEETAIHRVPFRLDLWPALSTPILEQTVDARLEGLLGFQRCTADQEGEATAAWKARQDAVLEEDALPPMPRCLRRAAVNRNPHLARLLYATAEATGVGPSGPQDTRRDDGVFRPVDATDGGRFRDMAGVLKVAPRQELRLRAVVSNADHEHHQVLGSDPVTGKVTLTDQDEEMAFAWFTTAGTITEDTREAGGGEARFTVGADTPDGPVFVWVVVRDQRGGLTWGRFDFDSAQGPRRGLSPL